MTGRGRVAFIASGMHNLSALPPWSIHDKCRSKHPHNECQIWWSPCRETYPPHPRRAHAEIHPRLRGMPGLYPNVYSAHSIPCIPPWLLTYGPSLQKLLGKARGRSAEQRTHWLWCWALAGDISRVVAQRGTLESDSGNFLLQVTHPECGCEVGGG